MIPSEYPSPNHDGRRSETAPDRTVHHAVRSVCGHSRKKTLSSYKGNTIKKSGIREETKEQRTEKNRRFIVGPTTF